MNIHPDIRQAHTLPTDFYNSEALFHQSLESIFSASWQYVADRSEVNEPGQVLPFILLENALDEPLLLSCDKEGQLRCMSNVCTHRGKVIVEQAGKMPQLRCGYHGRCFRLDGSFKSTPGFEDALDFPSPADNLAQVDWKEWLGLLFVSLQPGVGFDEVFGPLQQRMSWWPWEEMQFVPEASQDYFLDAHWALYCDNYLEGFHIPFVHPALNKALQFDDYGYELFSHASLQLGIAKEGEPVFDLPPNSPDYGKRVYAYYFWVFPNLMFNFYPWGLSLNIVYPINHQRTRISFRTYALNDRSGEWATNQLHQTEMEDEAVVASVQQGIRSRYYRKGRFSPSMERGVHHFHGLVAGWMGVGER